MCSDSSGQDQNKQCGGKDGDTATKKSDADQSCCSSKNEESNHDTGAPEVSVFEFMR